MLYRRAAASSPSEAISLEAYVERAGAALACAYSSSAEFDAALIAARRAAGVYGPNRQRRHVVMGIAAVAAALVIIVFVVCILG